MQGHKEVGRPGLKPPRSQSQPKEVLDGFSCGTECVKDSHAAAMYVSNQREHPVTGVNSVLLRKIA